MLPHIVLGLSLTGRFGGSPGALAQRPPGVDTRPPKRNISGRFNRPEAHRVKVLCVLKLARMFYDDNWPIMAIDPHSKEAI